MAGETSTSMQEKKIRFAVGRVKGLNKAAAAEFAGYSKSSCRSNGTRLDKDPFVQAEIIRLRKIKESLSDAPNPRNALEPPSKTSVDNMRFDDPEEFLKSVMNDVEVELKERIDVAKYLRNTSRKPTQGKSDSEEDEKPQKPERKSKKQEQQEAADQIASGAKYKTGKAPKLQAVN